MGACRLELWSLLFVCAAAPGGAGPWENVRPDDPEIVRWLVRSEHHLSRAVVEEQIGSAAILLDLYVRLRQFRTALSHVAAIADPAAQAEQGVALCGSLAMHGEFDRAIRLAQDLEAVPSEVQDAARPPDSPRTRALLLICTWQAFHRDFEGAVATLEKIRDQHDRATARLWVAKSQARAGRYDEALQNLALAEASWAGDRAVLNETKYFILKCRSEGRNDPSPPRHRMFLEELRGAANVFGEGAENAGTVDEMEAKAPSIASPGRRADAFLAIAWRHLRNGNLARCRAAAERSAEAARAMPDALPFPKALKHILLADLYLELGDTDSAKMQVLAADGLGFTSSIDKGLSAIILAPLAVSVYVRMGNLAKAVSLAERTEPEDGQEWSCSDLAWASLGLACAWEDRLEDVEKVIQTTKSHKTKAILCAAVACGLNEKRYAQAGSRRERKDR